jgi:hypothetical protein
VSRRVSSPLARLLMLQQLRSPLPRGSDGMLLMALSGTWGVAQGAAWLTIGVACGAGCSVESSADYPDEVQLRAMGYVEGYLTAPAILDHM